MKNVNKNVFNKKLRINKTSVWFVQKWDWKIFCLIQLKKVNFYTYKTIVINNVCQTFLCLTGIRMCNLFMSTKHIWKQIPRSKIDFNINKKKKKNRNNYVEKKMPRAGVSDQQTHERNKLARGGIKMLNPPLYVGLYVGLSKDRFWCVCVYIVC